MVRCVRQSATGLRLVIHERIANDGLLFRRIYTSCVCRQPNTAVVDSRRLHGSAGASTKMALCYLRQAQLELQIYFRLFGGFGVTDDAQVLGWI